MGSLGENDIGDVWTIVETRRGHEIVNKRVVRCHGTLFSEICDKVGFMITLDDHWPSRCFRRSVFTSTAGIEELDVGRMI